jgi:hypothetical protein
MLSKCANPACSTPFRYLRDGKLFEIEANREIGSSVDAGKPLRRVEFFWLCGGCSADLTVINDQEKGVITVPIVQATKFLVRRAAA